MAVVTLTLIDDDKKGLLLTLTSDEDLDENGEARTFAQAIGRLALLMIEREVLMLTGMKLKQADIH